jgi:hypothetical protein
MDMARITIEMNDENAGALAQLAKRFSTVEARTLSDHLKQYSDGRTEAEHMMSSVNLLRRALAKAGYDPSWMKVMHRARH